MMDIQSCLVKLGYKAVVWGNSYEGIKPHELETKSIPALAELEAVWPQIEAERIAAEQMAAVKQSLVEIDIASIRSIRECLAAKEDAPQYLKEHELRAAERREMM